MFPRRKIFPRGVNSTQDVRKFCRFAAKKFLRFAISEKVILQNVICMMGFKILKISVNLFL